MDAYIRNELSVDSDLTLDQAATHSAKLIAWLLDCQDQMQLGQPKYLELTHTDIECMFKATLYLHECHARHGDELVEAVLLQCPQAHAAIRGYYDKCETDREQCIKELCINIVNGTHNGHAHAPLLYHMHKTYAEVQPAWGIIKDLDWSAMAQKKANSTLDAATAAAAVEMNVNVLQMRQLVRRIFRLATVDDIKIALKRAMRLISCELWLQLFREPKESILYTRCYVLRQMICDMLAEGTACPASACFVQNIYHFVANGSSSSNVSRLFCWLMHARFAGALGSYLFGYWQQQLPHLRLDDVQCTGDAPMAALPLDEMLYLTHLLLTTKSPCRSQFYGELQALPQLGRLRELLNKVAYVYS